MAADPKTEVIHLDLEYGSGPRVVDHQIEQHNRGRRVYTRDPPASPTIFYRDLATT